MSLRSAYRDISRRIIHRPVGAYDRLILGDEPQIIRLVNGGYEQTVLNDVTGQLITKKLPFYIIRRHWIPSKKRYAICGKAHDLDDSICIGCDQGYKLSVGYVHTVIHLAYYHKVEYTDKDGNVVLRDGRPVLIDRPCEGEECKMCKMKKEKFFGKKLHWTVSARAMDQLEALEDIISGTCMCGTELIIVGYTCPRCGQPVEATKKEAFCAGCKRFVRPKITYKCTGCEKPRPVSIYDIDIAVKKVGSGTDTTISVFPKSPPGPPAGYKGSMEPLDLKSIFRPPIFREQREIYDFHGEINVEGEIEQSEEPTPDPDWLHD